MARKPAMARKPSKKAETSRYPKRDLSKEKVKTKTSAGKKTATKKATQKKLPAEKAIKKKIVGQKKNNSGRKTHPSYIRMISEALNELHPKRGVGYKAVANYIEFKYPVKDKFSRYVKQSLRSGLQSGLFQIAPIAKYRLSVKGRKLLQCPLQKSKKKTTTKTPKSNVKKPKMPSSNDSEKTKMKSRSKSPSKEKKKPKIQDKKKSPSEKKTKKKSDSSQNSDTVKEKSKYDYIWQYRENNGTWGDYDLKPSDVLEEVYQAYLENREGTDVRTVKSGQWEYEVDFKSMQQTNMQHPSRTVRPIRRLLRTSV